MSYTSYPSALLLDAQNNPITPLVDVDSIYIDASTKESESVVCRQNIVNFADASVVPVKSEADDDTWRLRAGGGRELRIVTDVSIGQPRNEGGIWYPSHYINIETVDFYHTLKTWFEGVYLREKLGYEIVFGTCSRQPVEFNGDILTLEGGDTIVTVGDTAKRNRMFRINDYNSMNFLATDDGDFPVRGTVRPSAEYIWFIIKLEGGRTVDLDTVHLYGATGEDSPQEVDIHRLANEEGVFSIDDSKYLFFISDGKFGIDRQLNTNDELNDGFPYNIYVKYRFAEA